MQKLIFSESYRKEYNAIKDYDEYFVDCTFYNSDGSTFNFTVKTSKQKDIDMIEGALTLWIKLS